MMNEGIKILQLDWNIEGTTTTDSHAHTKSIWLVDEIISI